MRLFIAEKPSAAKSLAAELGSQIAGNGFIQCGDDCVTWCFGHLFEMAQPEHYNSSLKVWRMEDLPIVPVDWELLPKNDARAQIAIIGSLLKQSSEAVNFGDPDNEGQLLVDNVLEHFNYQKPIKRLWISALDSVSVQRGLNALEDNAKYRGHNLAASGRGKADWLIGMNLSRAFTLFSQAKGVSGVVTVGRVQTPTLAIVAARDRAIANFKAIAFHVIKAHVKHANGNFIMTWKAQDNQPGLDIENRLIDTGIAGAIISNIGGQKGIVTNYEKIKKNQGHPKGLSLTGITVLASTSFGYGAAEVLEICQSLYETHKITSYPRSDCEFLPESQHQAAPDILAAVATNIPAITPWIAEIDVHIKSKIWDDEKVTAHHAIIPTAKLCDLSRLNNAENNVYQLIVRAYIAQFYPLHEYLQTSITATVKDHLFVSSGKTIITNGWKDLYTTAPDDEDTEAEQILPAMMKGDNLIFETLERHDRKTTPPKHFTEGTLLVAMENIHKYIENDADKKALKDGDGIGTPATRSSIISDHKKRGNLFEEKKYIKCSLQGFSTLDLLPENIKSPALTALYERQLKEIVHGNGTVDNFIRDQSTFIASQIDTIKQVMPTEYTFNCPTCEVGKIRRKKSAKGFFWGCSQYQSGCKTSFTDVDGKPDMTTKAVVSTPVTADGYNCPVCKKGNMRRVAKKDGKTFFWSCSAWRDGCKSTLSDKEGKPDLKQ